jgi:hypothetical protein
MGNVHVDTHTRNFNDWTQRAVNETDNAGIELIGVRRVEVVNTYSAIYVWIPNTKRIIINNTVRLFCPEILETAVRVVLRGRAHLEWKVVVSGDQQSISDDQYFIDERSTIWGKGM